MSHFSRASLSRSHRLLHLPNSVKGIARAAYALVIFSLPFSSFYGFGTKVDASPVQQVTSTATETATETATAEAAKAGTATADAASTEAAPPDPS